MTLPRRCFPPSPCPARLAGEPLPGWKLTADYCKPTSIIWQPRAQSLPTSARAELDPHVLFPAMSPSGDGLKLGILVDCGPEEHAEAFLAMQRYCLVTYGIEPDGVCKDVSRICFLPSDPELRINQNVQPLDWRAWVEPVTPEPGDDSDEEEDDSELPLDAFPDAMQQLATACADVYLVDVALPAVAALNVMSAAFGSSVRCAKATNGRETPCNLFTVAAAPSGYGKGVCAIVAKPLTDASHKLTEAWQDETRLQCRVDIAIAEKKKRALLAELEDGTSGAARAACGYQDGDADGQGVPNVNGPPRDASAAGASTQSRSSTWRKWAPAWG